MTELDAATLPSTSEDNALISVTVHQKDIKKANRWKPSKMEIAALKAHFQTNQYPTKDDKKAIVESLQKDFNSKVEINQLGRWFQNQREKMSKQRLKNMAKNVYKKFSQEELTFLHNSFSENNYPKLDEMKLMAKKLNVSLSKIENWYKHNRRSLMKKGYFTLKTKKYFRQDELTHLVEAFDKDPHPTKKQIAEIAEKIGCHQIQIKNWFSNRRKKMKQLSKKASSETSESKLQERDFDLSSKITVYPNANSIQYQTSNMLSEITNLNETDSPINWSFQRAAQNELIYPRIPNTSLPISKPPSSSKMLLEFDLESLKPKVQANQVLTPRLSDFLSMAPQIENLSSLLHPSSTAMSSLNWNSTLGSRKSEWLHHQTQAYQRPITLRDIPVRSGYYVGPSNSISSSLGDLHSTKYLAANPVNSFASLMASSEALSSLQKLAPSLKLAQHLDSRPLSLRDTTNTYKGFRPIVSGLGSKASLQDPTLI